MNDGNPLTYPNGGSYADLIVWHLYVWGTRPGGSRSNRGSKLWTIDEFLGKVTTLNLDYKENLQTYDGWIGGKHPRVPKKRVHQNILEHVFGNEIIYASWIDDLDQAWIDFRGGAKNVLSLDRGKCIKLLDNYHSLHQPSTGGDSNNHLGADAREGVAVIAERLGRHFYGRASDLAAVSAFVDKRMSGGEKALLIITAPAGFGKSALAVNWCNSAQCVAGRQIVSHLCSISSGEATTSLDNIYANLRRQLASIYGDATDKFKDKDAIVDLLSTTPPNGQQVVVWLDGIDEAREPLPCFLPSELGDRVCVIVSARADDNSTPAYIDEWQFGERAIRYAAQRKTLTKLSLDDMEKIVTGLFHAEGMKLSEFLAQLIYEASEQGYPLFARLMADDALRAARNGEQIDLSEVPVSFAGYAKGQLEKLHRLDDWATYQPLFALLTIAREGVRLDELPLLIGKDILPEAIPAPLLRWFQFTETGQRDRCPLVSMAHPRLAEIFAALLGFQANAAVERCARNIASIQYSTWPKYALRHLPHHLFESQKIDTALKHLSNVEFIAARFYALGTHECLAAMRADWLKWYHIAQ